MDQRKAMKQHKELNMDGLDLVGGGYLNMPMNEDGDYICDCGGIINQQSLVCNSCGASYGKNEPEEMRKYE